MGDMKARFHPAEGLRETKQAILSPTTHPKGGEAWLVTIDGEPHGVLRRWTREEMRTSSTPNTVRVWKIMAIYWTGYPITGEGRVWKSRDAALRFLLDAPCA